jgi:hypothetical protein
MQHNPSADQPVIYDTLEDLKEHTRGKHDKALVCRFAFAGCRVINKSNSDAKRHVHEIHFRDEYWYCTLCKFTRAFMRKDLFREHLRRMHTPEHLKRPKGSKGLKGNIAKCGKAKSSGSDGRGRHEPSRTRTPSADIARSASTSSAGEDDTTGTIPSFSNADVSIDDQREILEEEFEIVIYALKKTRIALPENTPCPVPGCGMEFSDENINISQSKYGSKDEKADKAKRKGKSKSNSKRKGKNKSNSKTKGKSKDKEISTWEKHMDHILDHLRRDLTATNQPAGTSLVCTYFGTGADAKFLIPWALDNGVLSEAGVDNMGEMTYNFPLSPVPDRAVIGADLRLQHKTLLGHLRERPGPHILQIRDYDHDDHGGDSHGDDDGDGDDDDDVDVADAGMTVAATIDENGHIGNGDVYNDVQNHNAYSHDAYNHDAYNHDAYNHDAYNYDAYIGEADGDEKEFGSDIYSAPDG